MPEGRSAGHSALNIISDLEDVHGMSFDYIVVGGGTSGCPLAATLSHRFTVLLVERGGSPFNNPLVIERTNFYGFLPHIDEFKSIAQRLISEDGVSNIRGRVLGGSSAINGGVYTRADVEYVERSGWDEKLVKESYEWIESMIVFEPKKLSREQNNAKDIFVGAGIAPFHGYCLEHVEGTKIVGSLFDENDIRHSAAHLLEAADPTRLTILLNATVKNIIFSQGDGSKPKACGIKFINSHENVDICYEAYLNQDSPSEACGDVILSAGALGSPQILMLSGIGSEEHLNKFNIIPIVDAPEVGQDIRDHPGLSFLLDTIDVADARGDPSQVVGITKDTRFLLQYGGARVGSTKQRRLILAKLAHPKSKGKLELKSTDPRQNPSVRFNYLLEEKDLSEFVEMVYEMKNVARAIDVLFGTNYCRKIDEIITGDAEREPSEEELREYCKKKKTSYLHSHGGCSVGSVIDNDYKVHRVQGVRVVDASALQELMGTSPMGSLLMLGRYVGVKILRERGVE